MNKLFTNTLVLVLFLAMGTSNLFSQMVWPGDVNNNGHVSGMDLLYLGTRINSNGPQRPNASTAWNAQNMGDEWGQNLPGTTLDLAYADANGDGNISTEDIEEVIIQNYGLTHGFALTDIFGPEGTENVDAPLKLSSGVTEAALGTHLEFELSLGNEDFPVQDFYGITFTLKYEPTLVANGFTFNKEAAWWVDPTNARSRYMVMDNPEEGTISVTITRINQLNINGNGLLGLITFDLINDPDLVLPTIFKVDIIDVKMVDIQMNATPLYHSGVYVNVVGSVTNPTNCPDLVSPVCGDNGITYLNSCYAEAAGVTNYTAGVCYSDCIDPNLINPTANCGADYNPVTGCNGIVYTNECAAIAAGVTTYTSGITTACYDPNYVVTSAGTSVDEDTGVISLVCTADYDPVCACDGITYDNACIAEASGITFYTSGTCNDVCIDPWQMDPDANCPTVYDPVCGCNNVTYSNDCYADAAGVMTYTYGACGGSSAWCAEATPLECGDFLANETTIGAGNNIGEYPGCSPYSFSGADRVYVINKTTAGDLQIGLEITTPGLDLDMFLLGDNCSQITCLRSSTSNNSATNNEGILYEDAPLGIYYIVVDAQYAASQGNFRLEVNCGYLYCGDATALDCSEPFQGNNINGHDDVSLYGCDGNIFNVENNGPEMVHYFTTTTAGEVTILMTGLSANLELFLLRSCDRGDCVDYSQNSGTANESITAWLDPGTYYVVVDGYNGAVSEYNLIVDCNTSGCDFDFANVTSAPTSCGQTDGTIHIVSSGGTPGYIVTYAGPISGSFYTNSNDCTISHLPAGNYEITKVDANGCHITTWITVYSSGNLNLILDSTNASCGGEGEVNVWIGGGTGPYNVFVSGPENTNFTTYSIDFDITGLTAGYYSIHITDATGCSVSQQFTIEQGGGSFEFSGTPEAGGCGALGSININTWGGTPTYNIHVQGPVSGYAHTNAANFHIVNLPGGTYTVTIEDGNWCTHTEVIVLAASNIDISATPINGACGGLGDILVNMSNGTTPFTVNWSGPVDGSSTTNNNTYTITNLPTGTYQVTVEDANWCTDYAVVQINNAAGGGLSINVVPLDGNCADLGALWVDINDGVAPYYITWTGAASGNSSTYNDGLDIPNLPAGCYTVEITDANGCSNNQYVCLSAGGNVDVDVTPTDGGCGQNGSIYVSITGGSPNYIISWDGPSAGSVTINTNNYTIPNLPSGTYSVNIADANDCTDYAATQINNSGGGVLELNATPIDGSCNELGGIWLDINGGSAPYNISWTGSSSGSIDINTNGVNIPNLPAGTYWLYATDAYGCTGTVNVTVSQNDDLQVSLSSTDASCTGYGSIYVYTSFGTAPYSITWSGSSSGSTSTNQNNYNITGLPAGFYSIWVTDANGCSADNNININIVDNLDVDLTPTNGVCGQNGAIWIAINGGAPSYTVTWSGAQSGSINTNASFSIPNLPAGSYTITVEDVNGCTDYAATTLSTSENDLYVTAVPTNGQCGGTGSIHVGVSGGNPIFNISWSGPVSGSTTSGNSFYDIINLPSGTYYITVTDANGCFDTIVVTINNDGTSDLDISTTLVINDCGQYNWIWVDISGGWPIYTVTWTGPQNGSQTTDGTGFEIQDLIPGVYTVSVTDIHGCTAYEVITIYNAPAELLYLTGDDGNCSGYGSITATIIDGLADYQITWTGPVSGSITTSSPTYVIENLPAGQYNFTLTDGNWCTDYESITINPVTSNIDISTTLVINDCGQYNWIWVDITGGWPIYTVTWTGPQNGTATSDGTGFEIQDLIPGVYTVSVTDIHGCTSYEIVTIYDAPVELLSLTTTSGLCNEPGTITANIIGGLANYQITWDGPVSGSITTNSPTYTLQDLPPGEYTVTLLDGNWCTDQEIITIYAGVGDLDIQTTLVINDCGQYNWIWVDITGGWPTYIVTWTGPQSGSATTDGNGFEIQDLLPGVYTVSVTDIHGCTSTVVVTIYDAPVELLYLTGDDGDCTGYGSITANVIGGLADYQITWEGPVSGSITTSSPTYVIENLPAGTYTVTLLDGNWCTDIETITINPVTSDLSIMTTLVINDCGQYNWIWVDITGGWPIYTVTWTGPQNGSEMTDGTGFEIQDLIPGVYTVTVTDIHGCSTSTIVTIYNAPVELLDLTTTSGLCNEAGTITANIIGGLADYQISWEGPVSGSITTSSPTYTLQNLPPGEYTVTLLDGNWCTDEETIIVNGGIGGISIIAVPVNGNCGENGSIWLDVYDGIAPYTITWTGPQNGSVMTNSTGQNISDLPGGTYIVTVVDGNGCSVSTMVVISVSEEDLDAIAVAFDGDCDGAGYIHLGITGGTPIYTVEWSGPVSGGIATQGPSYNIENLPAGTYTITVIDVNGCEDIEIVTINAVTGNLDVTTMISNGYCGGLGNIWMDFNNGTAPYIITWTGTVSGTETTLYNYYDIQNLPTGTYTVTVTDSNGCSYLEVITIINVIDDLTATLTTIPGGCGVPGAIQVNVLGGSPSYTYTWSSVNASGSFTTSNANYFIQNLPTGIYSVSIEDANGCGEILSVQLLNYPTNLQVYVTPVNPTCTQSGTIALAINGGSPNYTINWTGPVSGSTTVDVSNYIISNLPGGDYTVNITDASGCYSIQNVTLDGTPETPVVDFTYQITGLTVNFTNQSAIGTYAWTFGDGATSTMTSPGHAYGTSGTYEVCLTVTNSCGTSSTCQSITVMSGADAAILDLGEVISGYSTMAYVPVMVSNCDILVSLAGSIQIDDITVGEILGVTEGLILPQYNVSNHTFNYFDNTGEGVAVNNGDILFYFNVQLTGSAGMESVLRFMDEPLAIEVGTLVNDNPSVIPHIVVPGSVEIANVGVVGGNVTTFWDEGIENVLIQATGAGMNETEITNESGTYALNNVPLGQVYTFDPSKDDSPTNGLSTYGLFIGQRFILGMEPSQIYSPYQIIAGDANCSGSFSTLDLFVIQQLLIGATDEFADCPSWVFVSEGDNQMPADFTAQNVFPYVSASTMTLVNANSTANFIGVKVGDILGAANPNNFQGNELDERNTEELIFKTDNYSITAGETIDIPVTSSNFNEIASYQMGLRFVLDKLSFVEFIAPTGNDFTNTAAAYNGDELRISWFNTQGLGSSASPDEVLFSIRVQALENIDNLSELIAITTQSISAEAHTLAGEAWNVAFQFNGVTGTTNLDNNQFKLHQNQPNPFQNKTLIRFELPSSMDAELIIHDKLGREIMRFNDTYSKGVHAIKVADLNLGAGVYFYTLKAGGFTQTKSMVVFK